VFGSASSSGIKWKMYVFQKKCAKHQWNKMEVENIFSSTKLMEDLIFRKKEEEKSGRFISSQILVPNIFIKFWN
jgi:hypothetical protein